MAHYETKLTDVDDETSPQTVENFSKRFHNRLSHRKHNTKTILKVIAYSNRRYATKYTNTHI